MNKIPKNLIHGKNLEKTYNELADLLGKYDYHIEQCFTYESIYRLLSKESDVEKYNKKVVDINLLMCENSYSAYQMSKTPIEHEFSIEQTHTRDDIILHYIDRYLGILHLMMVVFNHDEIFEISEKAKNLKEKINFILQYTDIDLKKQVFNVIEDEEYKLAEILSQDIGAGPELLELTIKYGNEDEDNMLKILEFYFGHRDFKKALSFYNETYAIIYNLPLIYSVSDLGIFLSDKQYSKREYFKAVRTEQIYAEENVKDE